MKVSDGPQTNPADGGIRHILVASDLTAYTDRAFDRAAQLATSKGAALTVVHALAPSVLPPAFVRKSIDDARARLESEVLASGIDKAVATSIKVLVGRKEAVVVEEAKSEAADLIVMGLSHDASLTGLVRGTTIDKVVRQAHCPVLVVKTRARHPYAKIAVAIDLSETSRRSLDTALREFPEAAFSLIHVEEGIKPSGAAGSKTPSVSSERQHQIQDMVTARLLAAARAPGHALACAPQLVFETGGAISALQEAVTRLAPDLLVIGTHGRTGMSNFFLGSVAEALLGIVPLDMLVVRAAPSLE
jgi:nucleotide-binding universal stress UspA family protein